MDGSWLACTTVMAVSVIATPPTDSAIEYCKDMQPQKILDLEQLMGIWHTVEIIQHRDEHKFRGLQMTDTCPTVHFAMTGDRDLKMLWHEPAGYVEYRLHITDLGNPGFWIFWGPQNGSTTSKPYQQFAGIVQVMKAVQSHVVLTFCSPNQSHYSIILSRFNHLSSTEIRGVHNLLGRRGLPQIGIKETCRDSASLSGPTSLLVLLSVVSLLSFSFH